MAWKPDPRTIQWAIGILHEDRIVDTLRKEVAARQGETDDYWRLVAAIAVEHISADLARQAAEWERYAEPDA